MHRIMLGLIVGVAVAAGPANAADTGQKNTSDEGAGTAAPFVPPTVRYEAHISAGQAQPAAGKLVNPFADDKKVAATGEQMFSAMNCDGCHGGGATGFAAPSLADGRWRYGGADDEIFETIYFGRPKGMPAFGGLMSKDDVWTLVTYLRSLSPPEDAATQSWGGK